MYWYHHQLGWTHLHQKLHSSSSRYPQLDCCTNDPGPKFTGLVFSNMLWYNRITYVLTTAKNPKANESCECMHKAVGDSLWAMVHAHPPEGPSTSSGHHWNLFGSCSIWTLQSYKLHSCHFTWIDILKRHDIEYSFHSQSGIIVAKMTSSHWWKTMTSK